MNRAPGWRGMTSFRSGSDFCHNQQKCSSWYQDNGIPSTPEFLARCSFLIFLKFLLGASGLSVKGGGSDRQLLEYSEDNFRARERSQRAQTRVTSAPQRLPNSKAIRNNSELLCVGSRRNMFWWMRLSQSKDFEHPDTMLGRVTMQPGTIRQWDSGQGRHVYLASWHLIFYLSISFKFELN